jgi:hypothetical protein
MDAEMRRDAASLPGVSERARAYQSQAKVNDGVTADWAQDSSEFSFEKSKAKRRCRGVKRLEMLGPRDPVEEARLLCRIKL